MSIYTMGAWSPNPGREGVFVEAWSEFAAWASSMPGAGRLRLVRDLTEPEHFTSFGEWETVDDVRAWKTSPEFRERMAQVLQYAGSFHLSELEVVAEAEDGAIVGGRAATIHYTHDGITRFEVPVETVFAYMRAGNHPHQAFKTHEVVGVDGNLVTVAVEAYNPDGSTLDMTVRHLLEPPSRIVNTMSGGHFDGGRFTFSYRSENGHTEVDVEGEFPALPGMSEADELAMLDGFFTTVLGEDAETIRTWSPSAHG